MILYLSADLLWGTRIKGTAEALGIGARPVRSLEMLEARLADSPVHALVVDLEALDVGLALIHRLRGSRATPTERGIKVLAFGPHVEVEAFEQAREAGADKVLPRGAFSARLPEWLAALDQEERPLDAAAGGLPTEE